MRLYNPSLEMIVGGFDGICYYIPPGHTISLSDETARWILSHNRHRGLVEINPPNPMPQEFNLQSYIVKQTMAGLEAYIQMQEDILESWQSLDTELKTTNVYGTILTKKPVKETMKQLEMAITTMKDLEAKYGMSIMKTELAAKARVITDSIEATIAMFEQDTEAQQKSTEEEKRLNKIIKDMLPNEAISGISQRI